MKRENSQSGVLDIRNLTIVAGVSPSTEAQDRARFDEGFARTGHTIVPLVWELFTGEAHGGWAHWGATTQNIIQTGDLLVLRQAHGIF